MNRHRSLFAPLVLYQSHRYYLRLPYHKYNSANTKDKQQNETKYSKQTYNTYFPKRLEIIRV